MSDFSSASLTGLAAEGIALADLAEGVLLRGHAHGEPLLLVRRGNELLAVDARCSHFGAPLDQGLLVDDSVRYPCSRTNSMLC